MRRNRRRLAFQMTLTVMRLFSGRQYNSANMCVTCGVFVSAQHADNCVRQPARTRRVMPWGNDLVQFSRLLAEMDSLGFFDTDDERVADLCAELCDSTGLTEGSIREVLDRAHSLFDARLRMIADARSRRPVAAVRPCQEG